MKTTTISKLDFIMLCLCSVPLITLFLAMANVSITDIPQITLSSINVICVLLPLCYSVYRMVNGYKNIAALFTLCMSLLCSLSICASACGIAIPYLI